MIVPMKKVTLLTRDCKRRQMLTKLRRLGVMHIQITEGSGQRLTELREQIEALENSLSLIGERVKKDTVMRQADTAAALSVARGIADRTEEKKQLLSSLSTLETETERLKSWGEIDPAALSELRSKGIALTLYEMPPTEYKKLGQELTTIELSRTKHTVRFVAVGEDADRALPPGYRVKLPQKSTSALAAEAAAIRQRMKETEAALDAYVCYADSMKAAMAALQKEAEFETYSTGMESRALSERDQDAEKLAFFTGYLPADDLDALKAAAKENAWGLIASDPTPEDDAPTKLHNNKFVSLIYPMTDFLGTVPGYFEYDISGWFLGFILVFFGIIFGDGGYGLLICAAAGVLILKSYLAKKPIPPAFWLVLLLGGATVLWGLLTCTWFGLDPTMLPGFLQKLSVPVISNVYADKIWYPFWTNGTAGLTTSQNVQIFCFTLALIQLSAAHIKSAVRNRGSLKMLGDIGSVLQLVGIYYVVLSLVVNSAVFGLGLVIGGVPVGTVAIAAVGVGFVMSFIFSNYEGSIGQSVLSSLKNIVSVLLGVVNVFSDIVSYIRLWAVGLAGAAISATVNELASPLLGNFLFMIFAIILLVFGHGLNMILNVLSVIVHGIRLNTLEFSSHLDMSWSGHKYKPFEE